MSAASKPPVNPAPAVEETRQLPAFGSGLEFRPQGKLGTSKSPAAETEAAARVNGGSVGIMLGTEEDAAEEVDDMQDDEPVSSVAITRASIVQKQAHMLIYCLSHGAG